LACSYPIQDLLFFSSLALDLTIYVRKYFLYHRKHIEGHYAAQFLQDTLRSRVLEQARSLRNY
jgi:hypothetical protein